MGGPVHTPLNATPQPEKRRGARWKLTTAAVLLLLVIPMCLTQTADDALVTVLAVLWCVAGLYLGVKLCRAILRRLPRAAGGAQATKQVKAKQKAERVEGGTVAWAMGRASFSPSRASAERNLPSYCRRLIG